MQTSHTHQNTPNKHLWALPEGKNKSEFDKNSVLERFDYQLRQSGLNTSNTLKPDFSWAITDISEIRNFYKNLF